MIMMMMIMMASSTFLFRIGTQRLPNRQRLHGLCHSLSASEMSGTSTVSAVERNSLALRLVGVGRNSSRHPFGILDGASRESMVSKISSRHGGDQGVVHLHSGGGSGRRGTGGGSHVFKEKSQGAKSAQRNSERTAPPTS